MAGLSSGFRGGGWIPAGRVGSVGLLREEGVTGGGRMVTVIEEKRDAIEDLCRRFGVVRLYVFGSAVRDDFRPGESDVDLLVDFGSMGGRSKAHAYFDLREELERLLGAGVDLVMVGAVKNRYLARDIDRTKQELYAAYPADIVKTFGVRLANAYGPGSGA